LQQNSFDEVDAACPPERQKYLFDKISDVLQHEFTFKTKKQARDKFFTLTELFRSWNYSPWQSDEMKNKEAEINSAFNNEEAADA
jgi:V/A-type H+-transporting ATPase subunit A